MSSNIERDIGSILARLSNIEGDIESIKNDARQSRDTLNTIKGGWRGLSIAGAIGGAVATLALKFAPVIAILPK
jgi:hypothetical protein